ncbi:MAG: urease accessory protein UreD [Steroidobacteraceae bacterium]
MNSALLNPVSWQAHLQLRFAAQGGRTVLTARRHVGPLLVQRPFYPENEVCHVYVIHPPGGIAGGDQLQLQGQLDAGSHAVITTPAATKFYRALPGRTATLDQRLAVQGATLEWLPQETIFFNEAQARSSTRIELDAASRFIGWEITCYGRRAGNEPFVSGSLRQSFELWLGPRPLLLDHLQVTGGGDMQQARWGLQGRQALGTLLAYPATEADVQAVRALLPDQSVVSCTLVDGVLVCRCLADEGAEARYWLLQVWQCLRPRIVGRQPVLPRIWAT